MLNLIVGCIRKSRPSVGEDVVEEGVSLVDLLIVAHDQDLSARQDGTAGSENGHFDAPADDGPRLGREVEHLKIIFFLVFILSELVS